MNLHLWPADPRSWLPRGAAASPAVRGWVCAARSNGERRARGSRGQKGAVSQPCGGDLWGHGEEDVQGRKLRERVRTKGRLRETGLPEGGAGQAGEGRSRAGSPRAELGQGLCTSRLQGWDIVRRQRDGLRPWAPCQSRHEVLRLGWRIRVGKGRSKTGVQDGLLCGPWGKQACKLQLGRWTLPQCHQRGALFECGKETRNWYWAGAKRGAQHRRSLDNRFGGDRRCAGGKGRRGLLGSHQKAERRALRRTWEGGQRMRNQWKNAGGDQRRRSPAWNCTAARTPSLEKLKSNDVKKGSV